MKRPDDVVLTPAPDGTWLVVSRPGEQDMARYHVDPNRLTCDCRAGLSRRPCKHLRAVTRRLEMTDAG